MTAVDDQLRGTLQRLFPPADPSGVSVDVWERVEAGDPGTPGVRGDLPRGGALSWLPFAIIPIVAGVAGLALGLGGLLAAPADRPPSSTVAVAGLATARTATGYDCPGGAPVLSLAEGSRVLAVARTDDGEWLSVRDPRDPQRLAWIAAAALDADDPASLPQLTVGGCAVVEAEPATPVATEVPVDPGPVPSVPSADTTSPVLSGPSVAYSPAVGYVCTEQPASTATVSVAASDAVGVTSVTATWNGSDAGTAPLSPSGGVWVYGYHPGNLSITETITFTLVARDAAGNPSAPVQVVVQRDQCPG